MSTIAVQTVCAGVIDAGASRLGLCREKVPSDVAALIDHTLLKADATRQEIERSVGSTRVRFRDGVREPDLGGAVREAASRQLDRCLYVVGFPLGATTQK